MNSFPPAARRHGFRLSVWDGIVLTAGTLATGWLWNAGHPLWWIVALALGHFFLFCNVFLVWRGLEFIWAALFIINVVAHLALGLPDASQVLLIQTPVTILVILLQMHSPWYHGILARHINPRLDEFLAGRLS